MPGGSQWTTESACEVPLLTWFALLCSMAVAGSPSESLMLSGNVAQALKAATQESRDDPDDIEAQERLIDILLTLRLAGQAVQEAGARVKAQPTNPDAHYLLGRAVPSAEDAQRAYERALKLEPLHARSHMGMGAVYTSQRDFDSARDAYARAVRIDGNLPEAWLGLVRSHLAAERIEEAIEAVRKAIKAVPTDPEAYLTLAVLVPSEAAKTLELGAKKAGQDPRIHAARADLLLTLGEGEEAGREAEKALSIDPTEPVALRVQLFSRSMATGDLDAKGYNALLQARESGDRKAVETLVTTYPKSAVSYLTRSQFRTAANDVPGAITDLRTAHRLAPEEPEVLGQLGVVLAAQGEHAEAAELLRKAFALRPWDSSLGIAAGTETSKSGGAELAVKLLAGLQQRLPYDSDVAIALADALLLAGEKERAYQVVLQAAERRTDERLLIALMAVATQVGRFGEAADILENIGRSTNSPGALALAQKLRAKAE